MSNFLITSSDWLALICNDMILVKFLARIYRVKVKVVTTPYSRWHNGKTLLFKKQ
jgi:hypothetical protein